MTKYNELEITFGATQYVFVTRGRSKPFTAMEATAYLTSKADVLLDTLVEKEAKVDVVELSKTADRPLNIPDSKEARHIFRKDLQNGLEFCTRKYGRSEEAITAEASRLSLGGF